MNNSISNQIDDFIVGVADRLQTGNDRKSIRMFATLSAPLVKTISAVEEQKRTVYLPLKPAGYPISPEALDFGSGSPTATQVNNASRFSRLMNQVPVAGEDSWVSSSRNVWKIWDIVLDSIQLPSGQSAGALQEIRADFETEKRLDMLGNIYYRTEYSPKEFWKSSSNSQWNMDSFSPNTTTSPQGVMSMSSATGGADEVKFDATGMTVTTDTILVTLLRPWWSPWLFNSRNWRYAPGSLAPPLSDGMNPPTGSMAIYPNAFLVARNVKLGIDFNNPQNASLRAQIEMAQELSFSSFQLKGTGVSGMGGSSAADVKVTDNSVKSIGLQILGFSCNVLPKCPDPDPNLSWP